MTARVALALAAALVCGCDPRGSLVASAELEGPGSAEARFTADGKPLRLWANLNGKWTGFSKHARALPVRFEIDVQQGGMSIGHVTCESERHGSSSCGSVSTLMGVRSADCEVAMDCRLPALAPGQVVLRVTGMLPEPGRIKLVKNMSLHVREEKP